MFAFLLSTTLRFCISKLFHPSPYPAYAVLLNAIANRFSV
nr:MAG TPA: hypothetical protein [Caudoviricetes sp.]